MTQYSIQNEHRTTWKSTNFSNALEQLPSFCEIEEAEEKICPWE
jgi:hypothetical protein